MVLVNSRCRWKRLRRLISLVVFVPWVTCSHTTAFRAILVSLTVSLDNKKILYQCGNKIWLRVIRLRQRQKVWHCYLYKRSRHSVQKTFCKSSCFVSACCVYNTFRTMKVFLKWTAKQLYTFLAVFHMFLMSTCKFQKGLAWGINTSW